MVKLSINGMDLEVAEGTTILDAARQVNVNIPTLCYLNLEDFEYENRPAQCRVCMVEVENWSGSLVPACDTEVVEGMKIRTDTLKVVENRRKVIELLLANHPKACLTCRKNGSCELQQLSIDFHIDEIRYKGSQSFYKADDSSLSIIRDPNKCVLCQRCVTMCNEVQTVYALTDINRGFDTVIGTANQAPMMDTTCTFCGQCLAVCPTGALSLVSNIKDVYSALNDPDKIVVVQIAPAVRVAIGEAFGMEPGSLATGKLAAALRKIGFDYVFDTNFAADLTTIEEANEFVERFTSGENLPIITSCCPAWVKFIEHYFPDFLDAPSSAKSPHQMFGAVAKSYFAEKIGVDPKDMVVVSVMPCVAKKYESSRPELCGIDGVKDVDIVITTTELAGIIKDFSVDFVNLEEEGFDNPLGQYSGSGTIFGSTGGVAEAALRTSYYMITGENPEKLEYNEIKGFKGIQEASIHIQGQEVKIAVASGLGNARKLLQDIKDGNSDHHLIEIMACPGGCIDGGGQPPHHGNMEILEKRRAGLRQDDRQAEYRCAHDNPYIRELYETYLGEPGGERAHQLLHTSFEEKVCKY